MSKKPTITTVSSGYASNTQLNNNFTALRNAFDNTLSLDGSSPNAMGADIDLNGNDLLNAGTVNADAVVVDGINLTTQVANAAASAASAAASASTASQYTPAYFDNVADLLADTQAWPTGQILNTREEGFAYEVAASGASDQHVTTAGGVKLYIADVRVTFEHYGAVGDGVANDTTKVTAALQGAHNVIYAKDGANYRFTPVTGLNAALRAIVCEGKATFTTVVSTAGAIGLSVSNRQYFRVANIKFQSSGTKTDGNATVGLKFEAGCSLIEIDEGCEFLDYSGRGLQILQCVHASIKRPKVNTAGYGISLEQSGGVPCTAVVIEHPYIFDGTRGISSHGTVALTIIQPIFETCGATGTTDGALHAIGGRITLIDPYWESCNRDLVTSDCTVQWIGQPFKSGALAADSITFTGLSFSERGFAKITPTDLTIRRIGPDAIANYDLVIGTNLTAPVAGGSVNWGGDTMETIKGSVVSATWTTVKALTGQSGDGAARVAYRYAIYAGRADLTTGYDTGRILNGVIYSDSGATPAWLRISGNNLQIEITNSAYGLDYGLVLQVTGAIGT